MSVKQDQLTDSTSVTWDSDKDTLLQRDPRRTISFHDLKSIFDDYHYIAMKNDDPEQYMVIGWAKNLLYTLIYEERIDDQGIYYHFITAWKSTKTERSLYERYLTN